MPFIWISFKQGNPIIGSLNLMSTFLSWLQTKIYFECILKYILNKSVIFFTEVNVCLYNINMKYHRNLSDFHSFNPLIDNARSISNSTWAFVLFLFCFLRQRLHDRKNLTRRNWPSSDHRSKEFLFVSCRIPMQNIFRERCTTKTQIRNSVKRCNTIVMACWKKTICKHRCWMYQQQ